MVKSHHFISKNILFTALFLSLIFTHNNTFSEELTKVRSAFIFKLSKFLSFPAPNSNEMNFCFFDKKQGTVEIKIPPIKYEWEQIEFDLLQEKEKFVKKFKEAKKNLKQIEEDLKKAGRNRDLAKKKPVARDNLFRYEKVLGILEKFIDELTGLKQLSALFLKCPTCGTEANSINDFELRGRDSFHCTCNSCSTFWSIQKCSSGHCYPIMLPSGDFFEICEEIPGWVDRTYGADILAVPGKKQDDSWGFVCPDCGEIN